MGFLNASYFYFSANVLFGTVSWLVARENGTRGGLPAFLWGFILGPFGLLMVAIYFKEPRGGSFFGNLREELRKKSDEG